MTYILGAVENKFQDMYIQYGNTCKLNICFRVSHSYIESHFEYEYTLGFFSVPFKIVCSELKKYSQNWLTKFILFVGNYKKKTSIDFKWDYINSF